MGPKRAYNCPSKPGSVDGKWLPFVTLTEINGGKVAKSKKKTRKLRQLTQRRKRMVEEFMAAFQANRGKYGRYGSMTWIGALIKHMNEKRYGLLPQDVQNWLATEPYFKKFNRCFLYDASTVDSTSSSSPSFSSITGSNAETTTAAERILIANSDEARSTTNVGGSSGQSEPTSFLGIFSRSQELLGGEPNDSSLNPPASQ